MDICLQQGIHQEFTLEITPEQNGKIEGRWATIGAIARCLLKLQAYQNFFGCLHPEEVPI